MEITTITKTKEGQLLKATIYEDNEYVWLTIYTNKETEKKHGSVEITFEIPIKNFKKIFETINTLQE